MASLSLPEPPAPFACPSCEHPDLRGKAGAGCVTCPALTGTHYFFYNDSPEACDVLVVGDHPLPIKPSLRRGATAPYHEVFQDDAGKVVRNAVRALQAQDPYKAVAVRYTYGVRCAVETPNKATIVACQAPLRAELARVAAARERARMGRTLVVVACGVGALHALGVPVRSEADAQGRVYRVTFGGVALVVVATRSMAAIVGAPGKYGSLQADFQRAFDLARDQAVVPQARDEIERAYVYPRTNAEVTALCARLAAYTEGNVPLERWGLACDFETNTLYPYRTDLVVLCVSLAWSRGKAATIMLWHPRRGEHVEEGYDPDQAWADVCALWATGKPTYWHNFKYDTKVLWRLGLPFHAVNYAWDVMSAEHALEEDKKGQYSLKYLTKQFLPRYAGYEDRVREKVEEDDAAKLIEEEAARKAAPKTPSYPPAVAQALAALVAAKLVKGPRFVPAALTKKAATTGDAALVDAAARLCMAKKGGEFRAAPVKKEKVIRKGGYENVVVNDLAFYAAVDVDATRQLAILQLERMVVEARVLEARRRKIEEVAPYATRETFTVQRLCPGPTPLKALVQDHYLPRAKELAHIEYHGVKIDQAYLASGAESLGHTLKATADQVYALCGETFKLGSSKKLAQYLFNTGFGYLHPDPERAAQLARDNPVEISWDGRRLAYKAHHYTEKGAQQTSAQVLQYLVARYECPLANLLLSQKKADKALNSFFLNVGKLSAMDGGVLHPNYNLNGTGTGRLSSSSGVEGIGFNNQNIIKGMIGALRDTRGKYVLRPDGQPVFKGVNCKKLFLPDDTGLTFFNVDAKGAEVTIFAAYAKDPALIQAMCDGLDAHSFFGSKCLNPAIVGGGLTGEARTLALKSAGIDDDHAWSYEDFVRGKDGLLADEDYGKRLKKLRDNIKRLVFGLLYGAGYRKVADIAGISHEQAKKIQDLLFQLFPSIKTYMDRVKWELKTQRLAETYFGRCRRFLLDNAPSGLVARAERQLLNFSIQSTNSDIVLMVLCWVAEVLRRDLGGRLLLTVHDSLGFQVPTKYASQIPDLMLELGTKRVARECPWLTPPYRWDVEAGPSYGEVMPIAAYLASLPPPLPEGQLDGYTDDDVTDELWAAVQEFTPPKPKEKV